MERIKQALVKAKQHAHLSAAQHENTVRATTPCITQSIVYSQTRGVPLTPTLVSLERIVAFSRKGHRSNVFDILRTKVLLEMDKNGWRTLGITSPTSGCGKTFVSINLAMAVAQRTDRTALLVDFDIGKPRVAGCLGLAQDISVNDVLYGRASVSEALVNPSTPRFVVMPSHQSEVSPSELLSSPRTSVLVRELRDRYLDRIVLFDLPPVLGTDEAIAVLPQVDCVLLVIGDGESTQEEIEETVRLLSSNNLIGTVLNKSEASRS